MRREVLDSLISRGSLVGIVAPEGADVESLFNGFARSLCGDAPFLFKEFSAVEGSATDFLFRCRMERESKGARVLFVVFRGEISEEAAKLLASMRMAVVFFDGESSAKKEERFSELESFSPYPEGFFWWISELPEKRRFPKLYRCVKRSKCAGWISANKVEAQPEAAARLFRALLESKILQENRLEGIPLFFRRLFLPLCVLVAVLPFFIPTDLSSHPTALRSVKSELGFYSAEPCFDYVFDGTETLERIARYAVGRFTASVTTDGILQEYIGETLEKNGFPRESWKKGPLHVPPQGTSLRFAIPEKIENADYDSIAPAWKYFTGIIADSIAYVTELYHPTAAQGVRMHPAWDVASRFGARILAPFSGKAWTLKDARGGSIIGISDGRRVILFMHCDQLLYLDGQNVMQGDPVATVGMSGRSTGPHVHIVTGFADKRGKKRLGSIRYTVVNPVTWYLNSK